MAIYMEFEGIKGNVTAEGHDKWIELLSFNWGVSRGVSMESGRTANREATKPSISEVTVVKAMDTATSDLFKQSVTGDKGKKVTIHFCQTGGDKITTFMEYKLENVIVSSYSVSSGGDSDPVENLSLSFTKVEMQHTEHGTDNKGASPVRVGYDLSAGKAL